MHRPGEEPEGVDLERHDADVAVVGSGIAGAMVAHDLTARGRSVVVVEVGTELSSEVKADIVRDGSFEHVSGLRFLDIRRQDGDRGIAVRRLPLAVGGLAAFYQGVALRMRELEFARWPIDYPALEPHYARAEMLMGVSGQAGGDPGEPPRSTPFPRALPEPSELGLRIELAAAGLGMRPFRHPAAIRFADGCLRCFQCNHIPCPVDVKFTPAALLARPKAHPLRLLQGVRAERFVLEPGGRGRVVRRLEARRTSGERVSVEARRFVLAAGALGSPVVLLRSGLGAANPLIGTHAMTHCMAAVVGVFRRAVSGARTFDKWVSIGGFYFDDAGETRGLIQQGQLAPLGGLLERLPTRLAHWGERSYLHCARLQVIAEDAARVTNRVELDRDDGVRLRLHHDAADRARREFLVGQARRLLRRAGAVATFARPDTSLHHACGTCRMGAGPQDSVTDRAGRVWGTENLYVADASLFPTSSGVNPSLTIAANALRIASELP